MRRNTRRHGPERQPGMRRNRVPAWAGIRSGGNRSANNALWTIAMVRMRGDLRTREYVARRTAEGMSNKEIHRCLKRYIVRALYPLILADLADSTRFA